MSKQCPPHQILNPATNRCVNRDGAIGRKLLSADTSPSGKILNPATNRYVKIDGAIGRTIVQAEPVGSLFNVNMSGRKCTKKLQNKLHQCSCRMCWVVSSIVAIKFSNIHKYLDSEYKKIVKDAYNIFTDPTSRDIKCPYIPNKVIAKYTRTLAEKNLAMVDKKTLLSVGGIANIFIYSLLSVGLKSPFKTVLYKNLNEQNIADIQPKRPTVVVNSEYLTNGVDLGGGNADAVVDMLNRYKNKYFALGYNFTSGVLITTIAEGDNHAVAFTECLGKYYICNSYDMECVEIKNTPKFRSYISPLKTAIIITLILVPF